MRTCTKCNTLKPEEDFSFKNIKKGLRSTHCKQCHSEYIKRHYSQNKEAYVARSKRDASLRHERLIGFIRSLRVKCTQCGEDHPAVLDFHHIDPAEKEIEISSAVSKKQVLTEVSKCIVLCSNCHRKLHWNE